MLLLVLHGDTPALLLGIARCSCPEISPMDEGLDEAMLIAWSQLIASKSICRLSIADLFAHASAAKLAEGLSAMTRLGSEHLRPAVDFQAEAYGK